MNRVDVERGVFVRENMEYLTGEYEAFLYAGDDRDKTMMRVSMECKDPAGPGRDLVAENFRKAFFAVKPLLRHQYEEGVFALDFNFTPTNGLELASIPGRPKRLVDRR